MAKIIITFKDPDAIYHSEEQINNLSKEDKNKANKLIKNYFLFKEYVDLELDTETNSIKVLIANN